MPIVLYSNPFSKISAKKIENTFYMTTKWINLSQPQQLATVPLTDSYFKVVSLLLHFDRRSATLFEIPCSIRFSWKLSMSLILVFFSPLVDVCFKKGLRGVIWLVDVDMDFEFACEGSESIYIGCHIWLTIKRFFSFILLSLLLLLSFPSKSDLSCKL